MNTFIGIIVGCFSMFRFVTYMYGEYSKTFNSEQLNKPDCKVIVPWYIYTLLGNMSG